MSEALSASTSGRRQFGTGGLADAKRLSKLVYRSRAVHPIPPAELDRLTRAAQARNRTEAVTGVVLYDKGSFFQWLEGPTDGVERIMHSIRSDRRHTDIEVLDSTPAPARVFAGWNMKLAAPALAAASRAAASWQEDALHPPPQIIQRLRRNPRAAPDILPTLVPIPAVLSGDATAGFRASPLAALNRQVAAILKAVIVETVIPEMADRRGMLRPKWHPVPVDKRVGELADLLIGSDQSAALELIREVQAAGAAPLLHFATLFEPAARRLGDLWGEDVCTEVEVTLGLLRIQTAVRLLSAGAPSRHPAAWAGPDVLIAPEPGELHGLGAALDSEVMWSAGWAPHCEYPRDDQALEDLVAARWFDVLDLSLSAAFRREHWLPRLKKTIAAARQASCNPRLVVIVGGRMFAEHLAVCGEVGADAASGTALRVDRSIVDHLRRGARSVVSAESATF